MRHLLISVAALALTADAAVAQQAGMEEKALEFRKGREIYVPVNQVK